MKDTTTDSGLTTLRALLDDAAGDLRRQAPPAALRRQVLAAQRQARHEPARASRSWRWIRVGVPLAMMSLAAVVGLDAWLRAGGPSAPVAAKSHDAPAFVALAGDEQLRAAAREGGRAWIVRTELPRERLAALGLPYDPSRAGDRVRAELLMDRAGDVLAVRVLQ